MTANRNSNPLAGENNIQEGYIGVTGGKIWYKIVGKTNRASHSWFCTVAPGLHIITWNPSLIWLTSALLFFTISWDVEIRIIPMMLICGP